MTTRDTVIKASPEAVWRVLCDGWLYPLWVVGASRMREVDDNWPVVGSKLHHSVGTWPLLVDDNTEVLHMEPGKLLVLRARAWPGGEAQVRLELVPEGSHTRLRMSEDAVKGPGLLVPKPLRSLGLQWRNNETLRRLSLICENRPDSHHTA